MDYAVLHLMHMMRSQISKTMNIRDVQGIHPPIQRLICTIIFHVVKKRFCRTAKTKQNLLNYFQDTLQMMDTIFETVGDGDTLIVSTAIQYTKKQDNEVVVVANDTDILVLLIYQWHKSMKLFMHS